MLFLFGKTIKDTLKLKDSLKNFYGINNTQSLNICKFLGINPSILLKNLTKIQLNKLIKHINNNFKIEKELKKEIHKNKKRLLDIKSYRGLRLAKGLPVHGQRTKTNAKISKKKLL